MQLSDHSLLNVGPLHHLPDKYHNESFKHLHVPLTNGYVVNEDTPFTTADSRVSNHKPSSSSTARSNHLHPSSNMLSVSNPPRRYPLSYLKRESILVPAEERRRSSIMPRLMKVGGFVDVFHSFQSNSN
jgi:hypothetical protein